MPLPLASAALRCVSTTLGWLSLFSVAAGQQYGTPGSPPPADAQILFAYDRDADESPVAAGAQPRQDAMDPAVPNGLANPLRPEAQAVPSAGLPAPNPFDQSPAQALASPDAHRPQPVYFDGNVTAAAHAESPPAVTPPLGLPATSLLGTSVGGDGDTRRLAPPHSRTGAAATKDRKLRFLPASLARFESLSTAGAALAIVVGLLLLCVWMLRRGAPQASGTLPVEAFAVLGRAPLTPQSFAQLLRLGNKLILVAVSPDGAHPLAEVTEPLEVDRIAGLCAKNIAHGPSAEFQQVLQQLAREPARGFLGREGSRSRQG